MLETPLTRTPNILLPTPIGRTRLVTWCLLQWTSKKDGLFVPELDNNSRRNRHATAAPSHCVQLQWSVITSVVETLTCLGRHDWNGDQRRRHVAACFEFVHPTSKYDFSCSVLQAVTRTSGSRSAFNCKDIVVCSFKQGAQLSQTDRAAECVSFGQKWKTGTGRQYFIFIGLSSTTMT